MKQNKSIVVVVLTLFFSFILLSGTLSAQSFSGYKDFRFGMKRNDITPIVNRICEGYHWTHYGWRRLKSMGYSIPPVRPLDIKDFPKYEELTKTKDGSIEGIKCYKIFGKDRDVYLKLYSDTKDLYQIKVVMDPYFHKKPNELIEHYRRVNKLLRQKYRLDIPLNEEMYKRFIDGESEKIYEIYNDGKVVLSFEHRKIGRLTHRYLFVIYNNNHLAGIAVDFAKKSMSDDGSDDF